jgi:hypothetical protein
MLKWLGINLEGFGSEGAVINLIFNLVIAGVIIYFLKIRPARMKLEGKDRRKPNNPNDKPGSAEVCKEHMKKLTELETRITNFDGWLEKIEKNNREDHQKMYDKIDRIKNRT